MQTQLSLFRQYLIQNMMGEALIRQYDSVYYSFDYRANDLLHFLNVPYQVADHRNGSIQNHVINEMLHLVNFWNKRGHIDDKSFDILPLFCLFPQIKESLYQESHHFTQWILQTHRNHIEQTILDTTLLLSLNQSSPYSIYWLEKATLRPNRLLAIYDEFYINEWLIMRPDMAQYVHSDPSKIQNVQTIIAMVLAVFLRYGYWPEPHEVQQIEYTIQQCPDAALHSLTPVIHQMVSAISINDTQHEILLHM